MKKEDAIKLYEEGREFLGTITQGVAELTALDRMLYEKMQLTSYSIKEIAEQNPKATLADVLNAAY
ncbi:MAG: hypothetical protein ACP5O8_03975, partial [Candidatus Aenigmatarchaeota archaeon]